MTQQDDVIRAENLTKKFGTTAAVCEANLHLQRGEFLCLLGPSGCGKTTMLRLIAGLLTPDSGQLTIGGRLASTGGRTIISPQERGVGMVFQDYALFPHMTVKQNVSFGLRSAADDRHRVREVLSLVRMENLGDRMPHQLSGGQKQRVALARALAPQPEVVLMDEPFSNLDANLRQSLRNEVRRILNDTGVSVIFVTHDQQEAFTLSDRVAVMMHATVLQAASPERIYRRPATRELAQFVGDTNFLPARMRQKSICCEVGEFSADTCLAPEEQLQAMFRPEQLQVQPDTRENGRVADRQYLGHEEIIVVRLNSGRTVAVRGEVAESIQPGTAVRVAAKSPPALYSEAGELIAQVNLTQQSA